MSRHITKILILSCVGYNGAPHGSPEFLRPGLRKKGQKMNRLQIASAMLCLLVGGCEWAQNGFKVGPNYAPPPAPVAANWIDYQRSEPSATMRPTEITDWWHVYNDPVLNSLISDAYKQNLTLRAAGERIAEARALRGLAV